MGRPNNEPDDILGSIERELTDLQSDLNGQWGAFEILRGHREGTYIRHGPDDVVNLGDWR